MKKTQLKDNLEKLKGLLKSEGIDAFWVTSSDIFLSEYVPSEECHRLLLSGFTGSMGEMVVYSTGKAQVFVDGRYFEQADNECDLELFEVMKIPFGSKSLRDGVIEAMLEKKAQVVGVEGDRIGLSDEDALSNSFKLKSFDKGEIKKLLGFPVHRPELHDLILEKELLTGTLENSLQNRLNELLEEGELYFSAELPANAWASFMRGQEMPYQAVFRSFMLLSREKLYAFVSDDLNIPSDVKAENLEFIKISFDRPLEDLAVHLKTILPKIKATRLSYAPSLITGALFRLLQNVSSVTLVARPVGLMPWQRLKDERELKSFKSSFVKSDKAVYGALSWFKKQVESGEMPSEKLWADKLLELYKSHGGRNLSFKTIAGIAAHSSIIHYSNPSNEAFYKYGEFALLDSGAYFEGGFATDTTRTIVVTKEGEKPSAEHIKLYTLVLQGLIRVFINRYPVGTFGTYADSLARSALKAEGYDYGHGTGHGIGVNVHEPGYRLAPNSPHPLVAGMVGSIEPGVYIPKFGGVRLENAAIVVSDPNDSRFVKFESLCFIPFEENLIDYGRLTNEEAAWLKDYQAKSIKALS